LVAPDAWSDFLPESAALTADWRYPWVCGGCEAPKFGFPED
jgi:urea transport system substrate-binding protein